MDMPPATAGSPHPTSSQVSVGGRALIAMSVRSDVPGAHVAALVRDAQERSMALFPPSSSGSWRLKTEQPEVPAASPSELRLSFSHDCTFLACSDPACSLCRNNPNKRCAPSTNFASFYVQGQMLKSKCGSEIYVQLRCARTGQLQQVPGLKVQISVIDGSPRHSAKQNLQGSLLNHAKELLMSDQGQCLLRASLERCRMDGQGRVLMDLAGERSKLPELHIEDKTDAFKLDGQTFSSFRLVARAVSINLEGQVVHLSHIAPAISSEFVVKSARAIHEFLKPEFLHYKESVTKLKHIGGATAACLLDIQTHIPELPLGGIQTAEQLAQLIRYTDQHLQLKAKVLNLMKTKGIQKQKWDYLRSFLATSLVHDDDVYRTFFPVEAESTSRHGLLYSCRQGQVNMQEPSGLLEHVTVDGQSTLQVSRATDSQSQELKRKLKTMAIQAWYQPGHRGWAVATEPLELASPSVTPAPGSPKQATAKRQAQHVAQPRPRPSAPISAPVHSLPQRAHSMSGMQSLQRGLARSPSLIPVGRASSDASMAGPNLFTQLQVAISRHSAGLTLAPPSTQQQQQLYRHGSSGSEASNPGPSSSRHRPPVAASLAPLKTLHKVSSRRSPSGCQQGALEAAIAASNQQMEAVFSSVLDGDVPIIDADKNMPSGGVNRLASAGDGSLASPFFTVAGQQNMRVADTISDPGFVRVAGAALQFGGASGPSGVLPRSQYPQQGEGASASATVAGAGYGPVAKWGVPVGVPFLPDPMEDLMEMEQMAESPRWPLPQPQHASLAMAQAAELREQQQRQQQQRQYQQQQQFQYQQQVMAAHPGGGVPGRHTTMQSAVSSGLTSHESAASSNESGQPPQNPSTMPPETDPSSDAAWAKLLDSIMSPGAEL